MLLQAKAGISVLPGLVRMRDCAIRSGILLAQLPLRILLQKKSGVLFILLGNLQFCPTFVSFLRLAPIVMMLFALNMLQRFTPPYY